MPIEHPILNRIRTARADEVVEVSVRSFEHLTTELIVLVGDSGFHALYARCVYQTQLKYPFFNAGLPHSAELTTELRACLSSQTADEARMASLALTENFIRILTSLIGEHLTFSLLRSAWAEISDTEPKETL